MKIIVKLVSVAIFAYLSSCEQKVENRITVKVTNDHINEVNPQIFGHFLEKASWDGELGGDLLIDSTTGKPYPHLVEILKQMHIPNLRYPGGTDVDYYPWTDLIDDAPGKTARGPYISRRTGQIVSDNRLGLHEFLALCEELQSEPIIVVNIGDAFYGKITLDSAKAMARGLVEYCNSNDEENQWVNYRQKNGRKEPFNVKYFQLGNEPWLFKGLNMKIEASDSLLQHYYQNVKAIAEAILESDPDIKIITDGHIEGFRALLSEDQEFGSKIDHLAFHQYKPWAIKDISFNDSVIMAADTIGKEAIWNAWVAAFNFDSTGQSIIRDVEWWKKSGFPIAITEWNWNGWFQGDEA